MEMILPRVTIILFLSIAIFSSSALDINSIPKFQALEKRNACREPLLLTPYIEAGHIKAGQKAARVKPPIKNIESYSGFLTIDKTTNSTFFFWFFPAEKNPQTAPIALWLQGGPGAPSVYAIFNENGPYIIESSLALKKRKHYWSQEISVIYVDNPVGTGFSYTNANGYVTNESEVGRDLYAALIQFFKLFPQYQKNDFFVTGESYAGKYVPAAAYAIHINNPAAELKINLKGLTIGDGLVDPVNMMSYGEYLYEHGLIDSTVRKQFHTMEAEIIQNIQQEKYVEAFRLFDTLLNGDLTPYKSLFFNATGLTSYFNYVTSNTPEKGGTIENWIKSCYNRNHIHVGSQKYDESSTVEEHLMADVMQSVAPWLKVLIENYRVLLYNGQLDIIVAYPLTMSYVDKLDWAGKSEYLAAERKLWHVNGQLAGYVKSGGNFTEILVRDAGHMVPADQPLWALNIISKFTRNEPF